MATESAEHVARLNSVEDVMERLRIGRSKTYEVLGNGQLRSVKVGRRRLVSEAAIVEFIQRLEAGDVALNDDKPGAPEHPDPNRRMNGAFSARQTRAPASTRHD
jgi:excisionase family DNA binding protein